MMTAMITGWIFAAGFLLSVSSGIANSKRLKALVKARENARDLWRNEAKRVREELGRYRSDLKDRDNAIAALRIEIDSLTPKRNAHGEFVSKHEEI